MRTEGTDGSISDSNLHLWDSGGGRLAHLQRNRLCSEPQATWTTPLAARSLTSVGEALSRKVRLPSCPALLLPQLYTLSSVTAAVCAPPAAIALTFCTHANMSEQLARCLLIVSDE